MSILVRVPLILSDVIVIAVTWMKMRYQVKDALHSGIRVSTSLVMIQDGASTSVTGMNRIANAMVLISGSIYFM